MMAGARRRDGRVRILALSSGGGHWVQLLRLRPAFEGCDVVFATVNPAYRIDVEGASFRVIPDANRWRKVSLLRSAIGILRVLWRERPDVVVSTGAAPGYFAIRLARLFRARTIWVDSVANIDELSLSGQRAGPHATLWLTQWAHLAQPEGPRYRGSVL
jgi:UDP-N-acetylglucosamine:LPS N-acetylglucosamine transferase